MLGTTCAHAARGHLQALPARLRSLGRRQQSVWVDRRESARAVGHALECTDLKQRERCTESVWRWGGIGLSGTRLVGQLRLKTFQGFEAAQLIKADGSQVQGAVVARPRNDDTGRSKVGEGAVPQQGVQGWQGALPRGARWHLRQAGRAGSSTPCMAAQQHGGETGWWSAMLDHMGVLR